MAGISGDMNLGAMIDLGVDPEYLRTELSKLDLDDEFQLKIAADVRNGITGTRVDVLLKEEALTPPMHAEPAPHCHGSRNHAEQAVPHSHEPHHNHENGHAHSHLQAHHHPANRNLSDIEAIITASSLTDAVQQTSLSIFRLIAEAEAKVHGKALHEVHFHEVGATDSIVDIVGAAICLHAMNVDEVWSSPIELGGGFVRCAHGLIPVPAPATVEILTSIPTTRGAVDKETTTPTGAAILSGTVTRFTRNPELIMEKTAYGIGHRETDIPNVLRVHLAQTVETPKTKRQEHACMLQCNIDDMTAEMLGVTMEILMEAGAMDVHFTPIQMKKNRPATSLSLLCSTETEEKFKTLLFLHTTTLGIKSFPLNKTVLDISFEQLETPLGPVTMKNALLDGKIIRAKPELEDCRRIAKETGLPLTAVYAQIGRCQNKG